MRVLLVGNGGREDAMARKLAGDGAEVYVTPPFRHQPTYARGVVGLEVDGLEFRPDFVLFGPEQRLVEGLADKLRTKGIPVFGPNREAAKLEGSKAFAKDVMRLAGIPTAPYRVFSDTNEASAWCRVKGWQQVIKASGLAGGKGAMVSRDERECRRALERCFVLREFGEAGDVVAVEDILEGDEVSVFALVYGPRNEFVMIPVAVQDTKDLNGQNTGGMGCVAPVPWMREPHLARQAHDVVERLMGFLADRGIRYQGVLYVGFMRVGKKLRVLEFNVRFGDPETQALMALWKGNFAKACSAVAHGKKPDPEDLAMHEGLYVVGHVLASANYPGKPDAVGDKITGFDDPRLLVIPAAVELKDGTYLTAGGRVLCVLGMGGTIKQAFDQSRRDLGRIRFRGMQASDRVAAAFRK